MLSSSPSSNIVDDIVIEVELLWYHCDKPEPFVLLSECRPFWIIRARRPFQACYWLIPQLIPANFQQVTYHKLKYCFSISMNFDSQDKDKGVSSVSSRENVPSFYNYYLNQRPAILTNNFPIKCCEDFFHLSCNENPVRPNFQLPLDCFLFALSCTSPFFIPRLIYQN